MWKIWSRTRFGSQRKFEWKMKAKMKKNGRLGGVKSLIFYLFYNSLAFFVFFWKRLKNDVKMGAWKIPKSIKMGPWGTLEAFGEGFLTFWSHPIFNQFRVGKKVGIYGVIFDIFRKIGRRVYGIPLDATSRGCSPASPAGPQALPRLGSRVPVSRLESRAVRNYLKGLRGPEGRGPI